MYTWEQSKCSNNSIKSAHPIMMISSTKQLVPIFSECTYGHSHTLSVYPWSHNLQAAACIISPLFPPCGASNLFLGRVRLPIIEEFESNICVL